MYGFDFKSSDIRDMRSSLRECSRALRQAVDIICQDSEQALHHARDGWHALDWAYVLAKRVTEGDLDPIPPKPWEDYRLAEVEDLANPMVQFRFVMEVVRLAQSASFLLAPLPDPATVVEDAINKNILTDIAHVLHVAQEITLRTRSAPVKVPLAAEDPYG